MSESTEKPSLGIYWFIIAVIVIVGGGYALTLNDSTKPMMDKILNPVRTAMGLQAPAEPDSSAPIVKRTPDTGAPPASVTPTQPGQSPAQPAATTPGALASQPGTGAQAGGLLGQPPAGAPSAASPDSPPLSIGKLLGNPFGGGAKSVASGPENGPVRILQKCMDKLHSRDIIGAEYFVSDNGKKLTLNGTIGIHKILLKYVIDSKTFDEIGYGDSSITGQTTWVPIYSSLDPSDSKKRMVSAYIILANRGDGWKIDDLYDAR